MPTSSIPGTRTLPPAGSPACRKNISALPQSRVSQWPSARTATSTYSIARTSAGSPRGRRALTTSCSGSALTAAFGRDRACGQVKAAGCISQPLPAVRAQRARRATCAYTNTGSQEQACPPSRYRPPPPKRSASPRALRAYDPIPVNGEPVMRWSEPIGTSVKFALPGVGGGKLYVGTRDGHVIAFGSPITPILSGSTTAFPTTTIGESSYKTLTLTATEPLTLSSLSSSSSQFVLGTPSSPLPAQLTTGQRIEIPITFSPNGAGPIGATFTATTSTGAKATFGLSGIGQTATAKLEATPPLVTFAGTIVGERESAGATFRNVGGAPLTIDAVHLPSAPFSASGVPTLGATIEPGHSVTITITFEPTADGTFSSEIGLETTGGTEAVGLSGAASLPGTLQITDETNDYGQVPIGHSESKSFTIENTGGTTVPLTISKPPIGGDFTATTTLPEGTTIQPGESLTETVKFTPTSTGPASGVWRINGEKDSDGLQEVHFNGEGVMPAALTPSTEALEFSSTAVGTQLTREVTFTNTGGTTLEVEGVHMPSIPFAVSGLPAMGSKLAPGQATTVAVTFDSASPGNFIGLLALTTPAGETKVTLSAAANEPSPSPPQSQVEPPKSNLVTPIGGISAFIETKAPLLELTKLQLRASAARANSHAHRFLVSYTLSTAAKVKLVLYHKVLSHQCPSPARTCLRWNATKVKLDLSGRSGTNHVTLSLTGLPAGSYRLDATPISATGQAAVTHYLHFTTTTT
ncbi:MAG TPA: choice-of-anchor D domain-containing protein [Solirubrobacteraceae bacterium]